MPSLGTFRITVEAAETGQRLDALVASRIDECSRSLAAHLINDEKITVNGSVKKPGYRVRAKDSIEGRIPAAKPLQIEPQAIELDILYEDADLIVLNKQPGIVVHPAPGHPSGTLVNALLHHCPEIGSIGIEQRPGIIHRLDKDTSGVLVIAKNVGAHAHVSRQFSARTVRKTYLALVSGKMRPPAGTVELPIGRHPTDRKRMSTRTRRPRTAETEWKVREDYREISLLELVLKTGRTHQARVHCAAMGHPVVGDPVYGRSKFLRHLSGPYQALTRDIKRQMLHAWRLACLHPRTTRPLQFEAALPPDMHHVIEKLRQISKKNGGSSRS
jgi:23S rRNA pseudouridine1911/1915/1917 synthase